MEFDVVERGYSSLEDNVGTDELSEAEMLFTVLCGMWTKPSKKQTEKQQQKIVKSTTTATNCSQKRKTPRKTKKMTGRTQHEGKTERAKESHGQCSQPPSMCVLKTTDLGTQALLQGIKLRLIQAPMRLNFSLWRPNPES